MAKSDLVKIYEESAKDVDLIIADLKMQQNEAQRSREIAVALTHLETARLWLQQAIAKVN